MLKTIQKLRRLNHVKRCSLYPVLHPTSVAEHSFHVSVLVIFIVDEMKKEGRIIDELKVLKIAVLHDAEEVITSDIPYTVKQQLRESQLKDRVDIALKTMVKNDLPNAPEWLVTALTASGDDSLEYKIAKLADLIELCQYCIDEMELGNKHVVEMYERGLQLLINLNKDVQSGYIARVIHELLAYIGQEVNTKNIVNGRV